jgi:putative glutamine amidotransferase
MQIIIGITDTEAYYQNYPLWIKVEEGAIEIKKLTLENREDVHLCHGIVLSGGVDSHPKFYNNENINYPNRPEVFDEKRDLFELDIFRFSFQKKIPLLAICRGMQLVNIALGGDMIQDLEAAGKNNHRKIGGEDGIHEITITKGSLLSEITGNKKGMVNSAHHQAIGSLAEELLVNSWSPDGIIESLEWKDKQDKNFMLGVQWHPERLGNLQPGNPLSQYIRDAFLREVKSCI